MSKARKKSETVTICGTPIKIHYKSDMENNDGEFLPEENEIRICTEAKRDADQVLLHELIHAIFEHTGYSAQLDQASGGNMALEEGIVSSLEQHLYKLVTLKKRDKLV